MGDRQRKWDRKHAAALADIGAIPAVVDTERRERCRLNLHSFLVTYFPASTGLRPFSDDHIRVISRIQSCVLGGGRFVNAVFRGFAKTTISENAAIWSVLYGHRHYVPIFGADAKAAEGNIDSIKLELSENDLLYEDFPEVVHAIRSLEGKPQRCQTQTHTRGYVEGPGPADDSLRELTHIQWTSERIVLPTCWVPTRFETGDYGPELMLAPGAGAIIECRGLTAGSRGMKHKRPDGTQQRPDFVIIDDPQTDESATSPTQVEKRMDIIRKSILKLGGHARQIAVVLNATVIAKDDMVDQFLDQKRNAAWQGERIPMVRSWATAHETLWLGEYARLRNTYDPNVPGAQRLAHQRATEFYRQHRAEMDAGCVVSWDECYDRDVELSAVQHAYNALIDDGPEVFASEFQNQPNAKEETKTEITREQIQGKACGISRGLVPIGCQYLTTFVDVQKRSLWYAVCGWGDRFSGCIVDYGVYPEQPGNVFTKSSLKRTLAMVHRGTGPDGAIRAGLDTLTGELLSRDWKREDGTLLRIGRGAVDSGSEFSDLVKEFCRRSPHAALLFPSKGKYVGAASIPWDEYKQRQGDQLGHHWLVAPLPTDRKTRILHIDVNYWKSFVMSRLATAPADPGCLSLFGVPDDHKLLSAHLMAEYRVQTEGRGRTVDEWKLLPARPDNEWLDCVVGCTALASVLGVKLGIERAERSKRRRVSFAEMQRQRRAGR